MGSEMCIRDRYYSVTLSNNNFSHTSKLSWKVDVVVKYNVWNTWSFFLAAPFSRAAAVTEFHTAHLAIDIQRVRDVTLLPGGTNVGSRRCSSLLEYSIPKFLITCSALLCFLPWLTWFLFPCHGWAWAPERKRHIRNTRTNQS